MSPQDMSAGGTLAPTNANTAFVGEPEARAPASESDLERNTFTPTTAKSPQQTQEAASAGDPAKPAIVENQDTADAIVWAMTSLVVYFHRFGARQLSRKPRRNYPRFGPNFLDLPNLPKPHSRAQQPTAAVTSAASGCQGEETLIYTSKSKTVDEHYTRHLVDVKRRTQHIVILPPRGRT
jgi:hypothetical protein